MSVISSIYDGGGAKPVSWEEIGQTIEGEIVAIRSKQLPKFGTEIPETWDDGSPKYTPIVTVQTNEERTGPEDEGKRDIYMRSNAYTAFGKALREAYKVRPEDGDLVGATIKMRFNATEKSGKGQPRKLFLCRVTPKQAASQAWDETPAKPAAPVNGAKPAAGARGGPSPSPQPSPMRVPDDEPPF